MLNYLFTNFAATCKPDFFGLKSWYYYLDTDANCEVVNFQVLPPDGQSDFVLIGLALVDDLIRIAALVAIGYVIYGGYVYITSQGSPDATSRAQNTIQNALIGLVVALIAVGLVTFLGSRVG